MSFIDQVNDVIPRTPAIIDAIFGEGTTNREIAKLKIPVPDFQIWGMSLGTVALLGFGTLVGLIILTRK